MRQRSHPRHHGISWNLNWSPPARQQHRGKGLFNWTLSSLGSLFLVTKLLQLPVALQCLLHGRVLLLPLLPSSSPSLFPPPPTNVEHCAAAPPPLACQTVPNCGFPGAATRNSACIGNAGAMSSCSTTIRGIAHPVLLGYNTTGIEHVVPTKEEIQKAESTGCRMRIHQCWYCCW